MYLYKRKGIFYLYYYSPEGKLKGISTQTTDSKQAKLFMKEFKSSDMQIYKRNSFQFYLLEFSKCYEHSYTKTTLTDMFATLNRFNNFIKETVLQDITSQMVQNYFQSRVKVSNMTANKELRYLKSFFNKAIDNNWIIENPCKRVKQLKVPQKMPLYFTKHDYEKFIKVIKEKDFREFVEFAVNTGMRFSELVNLQWRQIINNSMVLLDNNSFVTKSKKIRSIPLNDKLKLLLESRKVCSISPFVFTYQGKPFVEMEIGFVRHKFKKYVKKANVNHKLHFHSLRHTFASWLVQNNVPIQTVSQLLGHSSLQVTQIYAHLNVNNLRDAVSLL